MNIGKLYLGKGWIGIIIISLILVFGVTACGGLHTTFLGSYKVYNKHFNIDNKTVRCLLIQTSKGTATVSCDWDHPVS